MEWPIVDTDAFIAIERGTPTGPDVLADVLAPHNRPSVAFAASETSGRRLLERPAASVVAFGRGASGTSGPSARAADLARSEHPARADLTPAHPDVQSRTWEGSASLRWVRIRAPR